MSLKMAPNRTQSLLGLARAKAAAGDRAGSAEAYGKLRKIWHAADPETKERLAESF